MGGQFGLSIYSLAYLRVSVDYLVPREPLMKAPKQLHSGLNRRQFLNNVGGGIGAIALAKILSEENLLASSGSHSKGGLDPVAVKEPHYEPKVKRVIYLFMHGGPSHVDLFDPKAGSDKVRRRAAAGKFRVGNDST